MSIPFHVDLSDKIVAVTGAGGVICSAFARALAECGAKVALLDINYDAAKAVADEIGANAVAVKCNCLDKESIREAKDAVVAAFGKVNFLINGAGGNNPRASTDNETMTPDLTGVKDFFALEESGLRFVFDLNITHVFCARNKSISLFHFFSFMCLYYEALLQQFLLLCLFLLQHLLQLLLLAFCLILNLSKQ